ncbi:MAG: PAS domain-containing sensor histidine kinase [Propionibacteriales bacterium]|nr:PAS domain-containing sensor histidine kinase [Propionibacteriales bacterium]
MKIRERLAALATDLSSTDLTWLNRLIDEWSVLADLAFADLVLWVPVGDDTFRAVAQVRPNTGPTSLEDDVVGTTVTSEPDSLVMQAWSTKKICHSSDHDSDVGQPVDVSAVPVMDGKRCLAVLELHSNRLGLRSPGQLEDAYLGAAELLVGMVYRHQFPQGGERRVPWVSPRVGDGMIRVSREGVISYASPNAVSAFRRLGMTGDLFGENFIEVSRAVLPDRGPVEHSAVQVLTGSGTAEVDLETDRATVRLRVMPLLDGAMQAGYVVLCRDTTELRSRERQLVTKDATIREMHHRVKNNLQTVAALLRLQSRRISSAEAKAALDDAMQRVAAIAVVHEMLSQGFDAEVDFDEVADRLLRMVSEVAATRGHVRMVREGSFGSVPADVATSLSLVLTELAQNAIEHGLGSASGEVLIKPQRDTEKLIVKVENFGEALPEDFDLTRSTSLGLSIVSTLVSDLGGEFSLASDDTSTVALVSLPVPAVAR